jgi:hypothetical protein
MPIEEIQRRLDAGGLSAFRRWQYRAIVNGECIECGKPPKPGYRRCEPCNTYHLEYYKNKARATA